MKRAIQIRAYSNAKEFPAPDGVVTVTIDPDSGMPATPELPASRSPKSSSPAPNLWASARSMAAVAIRPWSRAGTRQPEHRRPAPANGAAAPMPYQTTPSNGDGQNKRRSEEKGLLQQAERCRQKCGEIKVNHQGGQHGFRSTHPFFAHRAFSDPASEFRLVFGQEDSPLARHAFDAPAKPPASPGLSPEQRGDLLYGAQNVPRSDRRLPRGLARLRAHLEQDRDCLSSVGRSGRGSQRITKRQSASTGTMPMR